MCLIANSKKPKIAKEDVKCYKILDENNGVYKTPWQRCLVTNEMLSGEETLKPDYVEGLPNIGTRKECGFIHSVNGYEEAQRLLGTLQRMFSDLIKNPIIFECVIPKDAEYFEGFDNNYYDGFASSELKFVKEMSE